MKKDMGGAAQVLGLAHMIMDAGLSIRLRVLIPLLKMQSQAMPSDLETFSKRERG